MTDQDQPRTRRTRAPGQRSRARVVEQAAKLATIEGLEGLSIGRLAEAAGLPKSSVHALFGSKQELQLATINAARDSFITEVVGRPSAQPNRDGSACSPCARAISPMSSGGSSPEGASSSPHPPRSAHRQAACTTK